MSHFTKCNTNSKVRTTSAQQTPFLQGAFHLTQPHPHSRKHKHGRSYVSDCPLNIHLVSSIHRWWQRAPALFPSSNNFENTLKIFLPSRLKNTRFPPALGNAEILFKELACALMLIYNKIIRCSFLTCLNIYCINLFIYLFIHFVQAHKEQSYGTIKWRIWA